MLYNLMTMPLWKFLLYFYAVWNLLVFLLYLYDKTISKTGSVRLRVAEQTLLLSAFLLGGTGACVGVFALRHKSQHRSFVIWVPLCCIVQLSCVLYMGWYFLSR
ncbi:MAG: DUF1294 domain-containing protein [Eubacteriales bacterium]|jgi:uncharacterized membrane protein YsdA (DUF1294 family)